MIEEQTRPLKPHEKRVLEDLISIGPLHPSIGLTLKATIPWFTGIIVVGLLIAGLAYFNVHPIFFGTMSGMLSLAAIVCLYVIILTCGQYLEDVKYSRRTQSAEPSGFEKTLATGNVFVKTVQANAVIEIAEFEDEGSGYIYDIGDDELLFLKGQEYYPVAEEMEWPNSHFEIVRTVDNFQTIGIFCYGDELTPVRTFETGECREDIVWGHYEEIIEAELQVFADSLLAK